MWIVAAPNIPAISFFNQFHSIALYLVYENQLIEMDGLDDGERLEMELEWGDKLIGRFHWNGISTIWKIDDDDDTHTNNIVNVPIEIDEMIWAWNKKKQRNNSLTLSETQKKIFDEKESEDERGEHSDTYFYQEKSAMALVKTSY